MATIEKLRGISNWQTVVTVCFYLSAVLSLTIVAVIYNIQWLIAGGATTLGIVAGSLTAGVGRAYSAVAGNPHSNDKEAIERIERAIAELSGCIADTRSELLEVKNEIGLMNNE